jgi:hypothetical protein
VIPPDLTRPLALPASDDANAAPSALRRLALGPPEIELTEPEGIALPEALIARIQRGAEARARDRARRARLVEAHGRTIEHLLYGMRELAGRAGTNALANSDRVGLDGVFGALRVRIDAVATESLCEGHCSWTARDAEPDPAAEADFHSRALGLSDLHLRDLEGAIRAIEATEVAIAYVADWRGTLITAFRTLDREVVAVESLRANLNAASARVTAAAGSLTYAIDEAWMRTLGPRASA